MTFNKQSFYLLITSVGLFLNYSTHANVQYIVVGSATEQPSASEDLPILNTATTTTSPLSKGAPNSHTQTKLDSIIEHNARKYDISPALCSKLVTSPILGREVVFRLPLANQV